MIYQLIGRDPELMEIIKLENKNLKISIITSQVVLVVKNPPASAGDMGLIPGLGRSPKGGNGNPLQYSCLENPMDRGAWWETAHEVAKTWTRRSH